ncbi:S-layer homology domain-containing protein [Geomicrobium sp. JCM 19055]|uniref:S-layer homology domain-containing protein n=1 Tax=Geomicrobium sp. JCM 19055 TaxID=1460649 RepID=UPI00045ECC5F|nr:S-layer homology domain-containing protein [Geomicrobium sp. JCM 19055]GAJ97429.1 hypothetical protein JCM19055_287 [Geomicrobium sp. JCM 19055]
MAYQPKSYRKFLAGTLTAVMATTAFAVTTPQQVVNAEEPALTDVEPGDFAYAEIYRGLERGIINGYPDHTYRPHQSISRGQVANLIVRALGLSYDGELTETGFSDVDPDSSFAEAATLLSAEGIMVGSSEGTMFRPTEPISREQMASVLVRAFDIESSGEDVDVVDADLVHNSHLENVEALVSQGISVTSDNAFRPREDVTRAQFAVFLDRVLAYTWTELQGIEGIEAINNTTVHVYFEEPIDEAPTAMFAFDNELEVLDTAIEDDGYTVVLTTSEQVLDQTYTLLVSEARTNQVITGHDEAAPTPEPEPGTIEEVVYALQEAYEQEDEVAFLEALTKINEYDEDAFEDSQVFPDYITSYLDAYDGQETVEDLAAFVYQVNVETALIAVEAATEETIIGALSTLDLVTPEEYRLIVVSTSTERIYEAISELDFESEDILGQIEEVVTRIGR